LTGTVLKKLYTLSCFFLLFSSGFAQIDNEFWFVAPDIAQSHGDRPIYMRISTMEDTAHILLRMPANLSFVPITQTINPNTTFSINLTTWIDIIENAPANQVLDRGLLLTSDNDVTAYYEVAHPNNPGIFSLKGKNAVGVEFYIVSQNDYFNQVGQESFDIVATEDNTTVTIIPSDDITGHAAGQSFQITLNKGQTFTCRAINTTALHTLSGSKITSDKPIAISWQDDSIYQGGAYDVICDQIIPTNILGWEYIAIRGYANTNERIYVCGTENNTTIWIDGNPTPVAIIDAGETYKYIFPSASNTAYLEASKPVHVLHLSGYGDEFGGSILPQDSCTGSPQIGFNRTNNNNFALLILTRNGNEGSFLLNGSNTIITATDFSVVPGTGNAWVYARKQMSTAQVPVGPNLIRNTSGKFHLGILHQTGPSAEYGYFSDFSSLYLGADANICPGDSMILDGGSNMTSYAWYKYITGTWTLIDTTREYTVIDSGYYACVVNGNYCTLEDTIHIGFYSNATVDLGPDTTICQGTTITFNPGQFISYLWSTGYTGSTLTTGTGGEYWVRVENNNDCVARDTVMLYIDSLPMANHPITGPDTVCQNQTGAYYSVDSLHFATTYIWTLPPGASGSSDTAEITLDFAETASSGPLQVRGHNHCGDGPDTVLQITVKPLPGSAGMIQGPDTVCQNSSGIQYTTDPITYTTTYNWILPPGVSILSGNGNDTIQVAVSSSATTGTILLFGQNDCGNGDSTLFPLTVKPFPVPAGPISGPDTLCQGTAGVFYSVDSIAGASAYLWSLPANASITSGDSSRSITVTFDSTALSGNLVVKGWSDCGIGDSAVRTIKINPLPVPAGPISGEDTVCQGQTVVLYAVDPITYSSSCIWTLPPGASITSGAGTTQIGVDFSTTAQSGLITARGHNDTCGNGRHSNFQVVVDPLPVAAGTITGSDTVCQNQPGVPYQVSPIQYADSYTWTYTGTGVTIVNNGASVTLSFSPLATSGTLTVKGENACGSGIPSPGFLIHVNPRATVSLQVCLPVTTREAQPFRLRGGLPLGGTYSGVGVVAGWFTPSLIPPGTDTILISYIYTNVYGCAYSSSQQIFVLPVAVFACGDSLIDVRDIKRYPTVLIGSQCWMAANLDYGQQITSSILQRDNCLAEKYCYNDLPARCTATGGLYQWEEVMQYDNTPGLQGLCPPGWHIPTEADWTLLFNQYINNGFAGSALKSTGYSGFNALLSGIRFHTSIWKYPAGDPVLRSILFWSSSLHSPSKAWAHGMNEVAIDIEYTPSVSFYPALRSNAFAVRCLQD